MKCALTSHLQSCSGGSQSWSCYFCDEVFSSRQLLQRHQKSHPKQCDVCGLQFDYHSNLIDHHRREHSGGKSLKQ